MRSETLRYLLPLAMLLLALTGYRAWFIGYAELELFSDEAYYWGWSQHLAWGYYSKPPVLAALIALTTALFGDATELAVKSGALLVYPGTTALVYLIGRKLFDARVGFAAAVVFITMPGVWLSSVIISTDVPLFFFWALSLYLFLIALERGRLGWWVAAGFAGGLGLLSKYNMLLFPLSVLLCLTLDPALRPQLRRPGVYLAMITALLVLLPNLHWNWQHDFPTVRHTAEISRLSGDWLHIDHLGEFLGGQFGVFGILGFSLLLCWPFVARRYWHMSEFRLLTVFAYCFLAVISLQALLARAFANWAAPAYVAASILVAAWLINAQRSRLLVAVVVLNVLLGMTAYHLRDIAGWSGAELTARTDPYRRVTGWRQLGADVQPLMKANSQARLLSDDRNLLAWLIYYLRPQPADAAIWNPSGAVSNHYDLTTTITTDIGAEFVFVTRRGSIPEIAERFEDVQRLARLEYPLYPDFRRTLFVYRLSGFRGYPASRPPAPPDGQVAR